jgi:hypothetical protein
MPSDQRINGGDDCLSLAALIPPQIGIAVHIGARVAALASAGEVLVSSTVKDLVVGSGLRFGDRGSHFLRGSGRMAHLRRSAVPRSRLATNSALTPVLGHSRPIGHALTSRDVRKLLESRTELALRQAYGCRRGPHIGTAARVAQRFDQLRFS